MHLSRFVDIIRILSSSVPASYANSPYVSEPKLFTCIREFVWSIKLRIDLRRYHIAWCEGYKSSVIMWKNDNFNICI